MYVTTWTDKKKISFVVFFFEEKSVTNPSRGEGFGRKSASYDLWMIQCNYEVDDYRKC